MASSTMTDPGIAALFSCPDHIPKWMMRHCDTRYPTGESYTSTCKTWDIAVIDWLWRMDMSWYTEAEVTAVRLFLLGELSRPFTGWHGPAIPCSFQTKENKDCLLPWVDCTFREAADGTFTFYSLNFRHGWKVNRETGELVLPSEEECASLIQTYDVFNDGLTEIPYHEDSSSALTNAHNGGEEAYVDDRMWGNEYWNDGAWFGHADAVRDWVENVSWTNNADAVQGWGEEAAMANGWDYDQYVDHNPVSWTVDEPPAAERSLNWE